MGEDIDIDEFVHALDREALERVAGVLDISEAKRSVAVSRLKQAVRASLELDRRTNAFPTASKKDRADLAAIAASARKLSTLLLNRSPAVNGVLDVEWPEHAISPNDLMGALDVLQNVAAQPGKDGRRIKYPVLMQLLGWLEGIAAEFGGAASIKDHEGRLVEALSILRELLPAGMVPDELPYHTLNRWKNEHSRIRQLLARKHTLKTGMK